MKPDPKLNRRTFLGAGALAPAILPAQARPAPASYKSSAGNDIPFRRSELFAGGPVRTFTGPQLAQIAFPLGGIGTGTVSLGGRGNLQDWEIFNRPNKGCRLPFTFVAVWARRPGAQAVTKVVEAPMPPPFIGDRGLLRSTAAGLPRLAGARFRGEYPFANIEFEDPDLPVTISLEAFNPMIPLEPDDSALPVAILRYTIRSLAPEPVEAALAFSLFNPIGKPSGYERVAAVRRALPDLGGNVNERITGSGYQGILLRSEKIPPDNPRHGTLALLTTAAEATWLARWDQGAWYDDMHKWWDEFAAAGRFADPSIGGPSKDGFSDLCTLAPRFTVPPGGAVQVTFLLAWHFPIIENYWNREPEYRGKRLRPRYAERFADARAVAEYTLENLGRLEGLTRRFHDAFFGSTLPAEVLDAASSQASILRTTTCLYLEGRAFHAFEGSDDASGCCPMNCTHVWNYEQTLAHLYPELERFMRRTDFEQNLRPDGSMAFRTLIPFGQTLWGFRPAADGQMGCVLKVYREWRLSGDEEFLRRLWPNVKRALEYAWTQWDADRDGVMEGEQHNTYDIEFYGPNSMMGTFYLAALAAASRMAQAVGDNDDAARYEELFRGGSARLDSTCWDGDFYVQKYDETRHTKYQYGRGCLSDQLLGQWFATVAGLGYVLPRERVRRTLASIYRHNFRSGFQPFANPQRIYALGDEKGLLLCSWPKGGRPAIPFVYSDEVWTGIEYQVAAHLIYEGFLDEGLAIVKAARDRYDGVRRNPWNEIECGNHYARAMASWSLVLALAGYRYSAQDRSLRLAPLVRAGDFKCFYSTGGSWGVLSQNATKTGRTAIVEVLYGKLELADFILRHAGSGPVRATAGKTPRSVPATIQAEDGELHVRLDPPVTLEAGDRLRVRLGA
jgi:uncharacterized protein (DUF608 family)